MARAFAELEADPQSAVLSHAEWLGLLLDHEAMERYEGDCGRGCVMPRLRIRLPSEDIGKGGRESGRLLSLIRHPLIIASIGVQQAACLLALFPSSLAIAAAGFAEPLELLVFVRADK